MIKWFCHFKEADMNMWMVFQKLCGLHFTHIQHKLNLSFKLSSFLLRVLFIEEHQTKKQKVRPKIVDVQGPGLNYQKLYLVHNCKFDIFENVDIVLRDIAVNHSIGTIIIMFSKYPN